VRRSRKVVRTKWVQQDLGKEGFESEIITKGKNFERPFLHPGENLTL